MDSPINFDVDEDTNVDNVDNVPSRPLIEEYTPVTYTDGFIVYDEEMDVVGYDFSAFTNTETPSPSNEPSTSHSEECVWKNLKDMVNGGIGKNTPLYKSYVLAAAEKYLGLSTLKKVKFTIRPPELFIIENDNPARKKRRLEAGTSNNEAVGRAVTVAELFEFEDVTAANDLVTVTVENVEDFDKKFCVRIKDLEKDPDELLGVVKSIENEVFKLERPIVLEIEMGCLAIVCSIGKKPKRNPGSPSPMKSFKDLCLYDEQTRLILSHHISLEELDKRIYEKYGHPDEWVEENSGPSSGNLPEEQMMDQGEVEEAEAGASGGGSSTGYSSVVGNLNVCHFEILPLNRHSLPKRAAGEEDITDIEDLGDMMPVRRLYEQNRSRGVFYHCPSPSCSTCPKTDCLFRRDENNN